MLVTDSERKLVKLSDRVVKECKKGLTINCKKKKNGKRVSPSYMRNIRDCHNQASTEIYLASTRTDNNRYDAHIQRFI